MRPEPHAQPSFDGLAVLPCPQVANSVPASQHVGLEIEADRSDAVPEVEQRHVKARLFSGEERRSPPMMRGERAMHHSVISVLCSSQVNLERRSGPCGRSSSER